jgi:hypothetical protein
MFAGIEALATMGFANRPRGRPAQPPARRAVVTVEVEIADDDEAVKALFGIIHASGELPSSDVQQSDVRYRDWPHPLHRGFGETGLEDTLEKLKAMS